MPPPTFSNTAFGGVNVQLRSCLRRFSRPAIATLPVFRAAPLPINRQPSSTPKFPMRPPPMPLSVSDYRNVPLNATRANKLNGGVSVVIDRVRVN
jgi:hypothetical protein